MKAGEIRFRESVIGKITSSSLVADSPSQSLSRLLTALAIHCDAMSQEEQKTEREIFGLYPENRPLCAL